MTNPSLKYLSPFNYHISCLLKIRFLPLNSGQPSWEARLSLQMSSLYSSSADRDRAHFQPLSPSPSFLPPQRSLLFFFIAHCCIRFLHVANDCPGKGIFCFNLAFSQGRTKGTSSVQLVSLRKWHRIASFLGRLAIAYNPALSAIVCLNLAIILCLFPLRAPLTN